MNVSHAATAYAETNMTTVSGLGLVVQVYELTLDHLIAARTAMVERRRSDKGVRIGRALHAIMELRAVLDRDEGGELAEQLGQLYGWFVHALTEANIENRKDILDAVIQQWTSLLDSWRQASMANAIG